MKGVGLESEPGSTAESRLPPWLGPGRRGRLQASCFHAWPAGPASRQQSPVHLHPAASEQHPLEGAAHSREQLAPLWSQSREASWAKRQPEAASRHREFTVSGSYKSGLKPCPWDQPPDSRDLCSSDC